MIYIKALKLAQEDIWNFDLSWYFFYTVHSDDSGHGCNIDGYFMYQ